MSEKIEVTIDLAKTHEWVTEKVSEKDIEKLSEELTDSMEETLKKIGYGVFGRRGGFYDENGERIDMRSVGALNRRGLVYGSVIGGAPCVGVLDLTEKGWLVFYKMTNEKLFHEKWDEYQNSSEN